LNALFILLALLQADAAAEAKVEPRSATTVVKGVDLDLLREVRRVAENVEAVRGEKFDRPPIAVRAPDEMRLVAADIRAFNVLPRARLEARGRAWSDIGLGGTGSPLGLLRTLAADLGGIGFDPDGNRLLVAPDRLTLQDFEPTTGDEEELATLLMGTGVRIDEPVVGHLLVHVRQRERRSNDLLQPTTDALLAAAAWAEGEANLVAVRYLFQGMNLSDIVIEHDLDLGHLLGGRLIPSGLDRASGIERRFLDFVYFDGFDRVVALFRGGGWAAVDEARQHAPTTGGMLHPERGAAPPEQGGEPATPAIDGIVLADEDSIGEQGIVVLISLLTGKDNLGLQAGDGWRGDRLYRWETSETADGITEWHSRWSGPEAAADFVYGIGRTWKARFPDSPSRPAGEGRQVVEANGRVFRIERIGANVRIRIAPSAWDTRLEAGRGASPGP